MSSGRRAATAVLTAAIAVTAAWPLPPGQETPATESARPTDIVERTEARLAQLYLTVVGPYAIASSLTREDFRLKVNVRTVRDFEIDSLCAAPATSDTEPDNPAPVTPVATAVPVNYLFYFDQPQLTLGGRQRALDESRTLVRRLIRDDSRGMIASNARRQIVIEDLTGDPAALLAGIDRLQGDLTQWSSFASEEETRVGHVVEALNDTYSVQRAIALARTYQREELFRTSKGLRRLEVMLSRLAELPPPSAVLYFADTMRANAGEHYLEFFGDAQLRSDPTLADMHVDSMTGGLPFDRVINEASAHGVRFYSVQAQGLVTPFDRTLPNPSAMDATTNVPSSAQTRFRHAQETLASLATETGGQHFLRGSSGRRMADRILEDFSCMYVVSFDPGGFPLDSPLRVVANLDRDGVELRTRGRIVLQSERSELASRLLGAFSLRRSDEAGVDLQASLVPTGFTDGRYSALLQVSLPGTALTGASWDIGASMIFRDRVHQQISRRMVPPVPGTALVLECEVDLRPGAHEVVAVAHESATDFVLSDHLRVEWPDPNAKRASCGPVSLLQPAAAAFVREDERRSSGSLARNEAEAIDRSLPTALASLVCRGRKQKGPLNVERTLSGGSTVDFPPIQFELGADRCAQVRDVIPAETLAPGVYRYEMRVLEGESELHGAQRIFVVGDAGP